jgi:hypothetical protein
MGGGSALQARDIVVRNGPEPDAGARSEPGV